MRIIQYLNVEIQSLLHTTDKELILKIHPIVRKYCTDLNFIISGFLYSEKDKYNLVLKYIEGYIFWKPEMQTVILEMAPYGIIREQLVKELNPIFVKWYKKKSCKKCEEYIRKLAF